MISVQSGAKKRFPELGAAATTASLRIGISAFILRIPT
jgi:threonine/homoserine efflux transporter RhtA